MIGPWEVITNRGGLAWRGEYGEEGCVVEAGEEERIGYDGGDRGGLRGCYKKSLPPFSLSPTKKVGKEFLYQSSGGAGLCFAFEV